MVKRLCGETLTNYSLHEKSLDLIFKNFSFSLSGFPELVRDSVTYNIESKEYFKILEGFYSNKVNTVNLRADTMTTNLIFEDDGIIRCPLFVNLVENKNNPS